MLRDEVLHLLSEHQAELNHAGVRTLACFGSVARDEARPDSDLDLLVEFAERPSFARYMELKFLLEGLLGRRLDLVTPKASRPQMRTRIEREMIRVPGLWVVPRRHASGGRTGAALHPGRGSRALHG